jgi:general secretion pathway protein G
MMMKQRDSRRSDRLGFTLMEVLVVVAILVVLAGASSIAVFRYLDESKLNRAKVDVRTIENACKTYKLKYGDYPTSLDLLVSGPKPYLEGGQEAILDPWGRPYQYDPSGRNNGGQKPDISTVSPDGDTIGNWQSTREGQSP